MELMGVIAVIVNLALLGIGGSLTRMFPNMTPAQRIILIIVIEVCKYMCVYNVVVTTFSPERFRKPLNTIVPMFYYIVSHFKVTMATQIVRVTYSASVRHIQSNLIHHDFQRYRPP